MRERERGERKERDRNRENEREREIMRERDNERERKEGIVRNELSNPILEAEKPRFCAFLHNTSQVF